MSFKLYYLSDFDLLPLELDIRAGHFKMRWSYESYQEWASDWFCGSEQDINDFWDKFYSVFPEFTESGYRAVIYPIARLPVLIEPRKEFLPCK